METPRIHLVIPAFRESGRIRHFLAEVCDEMEAIGGVSVQVVDDGSGAEEASRMRELVEGQRESTPCLMPLLELPENQGKGGAIYAGWRAAPESSEILGFVDADGSCAADEVARLAGIARSRPNAAIFASRLKILGKSVDRKLLRHLFGRVYATCVSTILGIPIYDSQCGLKFVPATAFHSNESSLRSTGFAFDAELLVVLLDSGVDVYEEPINWHEIGGGKVSMIRDPLRMLFELLEIRRRRKVRQRRVIQE